MRPFPTFQLQSFLKNIKNFLCKQKIVNNCIIPSMQAIRKIAIFFINTLLLYVPVLALTDGQNYRQRVKYNRCAWAGGTGNGQFPINKVPFVCCVIIFVRIVFPPIRFGGSIFCMRQCLVSHHSEKICSSVCVVSHHL